MSLRRPLIAASLAATVAAGLAPLPALAQDRDYRADESGEIADKLRDPVNQIAVAAVLSSMSEALLDFRIGPMVEAMDKAGIGGHRVRDLPPDARLGDVAGRDAREMPSKIAREAPRMMGAAAGMAGALDDMKPQFKEMRRKLKEAMSRY